MIEVKKSNNSILNETVITLYDSDLNTAGTYSINWGGQIIIYVTFLNNAGIDFNSLTIRDAANNQLIHPSQVHNDSYSICFSGDGGSQPLAVTNTANLTNLTFDYSFAGLAVGSVTIKIYSKNL